jgi:RNA polymerase sigma-70 factor (ECF subfamily)
VAIVKKLIEEYRITLRHVNKAKTKATNPEDRSLLASCADSLSFSIEYMEKGKNPNSRRGITRLSSTQREIPVDPRNVAFVRAAVLQSQAPEISEKMRRAIVDLDIVLRDLSEKEQEAYSLVRGSSYSFAAAAVIMDVQKGTVQTLVRRAEDKIRDMVEDLTDHGIIFKQDIQLEMF